MKKLMLIAGLFVLAFSITAFSVVSFSTEKVKSVSAPAETTTPEGMERVVYKFKSDTIGQARWLKLNDNLDNYSLAGANEIVNFIPKGSRPDCECNAPEPENRLRPTQICEFGTPCYWTCVDNCNPQEACTTE